MQENKIQSEKQKMLENWQIWKFIFWVFQHLKGKHTPKTVYQQKVYGKTKILRPIRRNSTFLTKGAKKQNAPDRRLLTSALPRMVIYVRSGPFFCCSYGQNIIFLFQLGENAFFSITPCNQKSIFDPRRRKKKLRYFRNSHLKLIPFSYPNFLSFLVVFPKSWCQNRLQ